jgi:hypothetical protein
MRFQKNTIAEPTDAVDRAESLLLGFAFSQSAPAIGPSVPYLI